MHEYPLKELDTESNEMTDQPKEVNPNNSLVELANFYSTDVIYPPKLLIPSVSLEDYTESICPDSYNKENFSSSSPQVLIGQGINQNGGISLVQVIGSKTPSYEDFQNRSQTIVHHKKTMLDGLIASSGLEAPTTTYKTFIDLSQKLLQLPVKDPDTPEQARYINGLPYFDENESLYKISQLKRANKLKDIENLHGAVILNQLLNNKRKLRNYQWKQYYADRSGSSDRNNLQVSLKSNIKEGAVLLDEEALIEEQKKEAEKQRAKALKLAQEQALANGMEPIQDPLEQETSEQKLQRAKEESEAKYNRITNRIKEQHQRRDIKKRKRFIYDNNEYIADMIKDTIVIEEEVIAQNLNYIPGYQNNQPAEVRKLVRKRRRPNANTIGHSNIRGVRPTYWR